MHNKKRSALFVVASMALLATLTGCNKAIDAGAVGASSVPGASHMKRFCDGPVLMYYSDLDGGTDELEYILAGGCFYNLSTRAWEYDQYKLDAWLRGKDVDLAENTGGN